MASLREVVWFLSSTEHAMYIIQAKTHDGENSTTKYYPNTRYVQAFKRLQHQTSTASLTMTIHTLTQPGVGWLQMTPTSASCPQPVVEPWVQLTRRVSVPLHWVFPQWIGVVEPAPPKCILDTIWKTEKRSTSMEQDKVYFYLPHGLYMPIHAWLY